MHKLAIAVLAFDLLLAIVARTEAVANSSTCTSLPYGNQKVLAFDGSLNIVKLSPDKSWLAMGGDNKELISILHGNETKLSLSSEISTLAFSSDSKLLAVGTNGGVVSLLNQNLKKIYTYKNWEKVTTIRFFKNVLVSGGVDGRVVITRFPNKKQKIISLDGVIKSLALNSNEDKIIAGTADGRVVLIDLQDRNKTKVILQRAFDINSVDINGDLVAVGGNEKFSILRNLQTNQQNLIQHNNDVTYVQFSPDGKKLITASADHILKITNVSKPTESRLITHDFSVSAIAFEQNSNLLVVGYTDGLIKIINLNTGSIYNEIKLRNQINSLDITAKAKQIIAASSDNTLHTVDNSTICQEQLDTTNKCFLEDSFLTSTLLYEALVQKGISSKHCEKTTSTELIKKSEEYLQSLIIRNPSQTTLQDWVTLGPISKYISQLDEHTRVKYHEHVAQTLADHAAARQFKGIFLSKLVKLAYRATRHFFGEGKDFYTDLSYRRNFKQIEPIVFGLYPINNNPESITPYGFYAQSLPPIALPSQLSNTKTKEIFSGKYFWTQVKKSFTASMNISALDKNLVIAEGSSPDYEAMLRDKKLTGLVVTGVSLDSANDVIESYESYFKAQGFKFSLFNEEIDLENFLLEQTANGALDYFIKEAHSDGDDRNLFQMDRIASVLVGKKTNNNGIEEIVYLAKPYSGKDRETIMLSNVVFGEAIRARERIGAIPIIYLNTSCWSASKAVHEIEATHSPLLINIPTLTSAETFNGNKADNSLKILLDGIRSFQSYEEIRHALMANSDYASGVSNIYIFPDDEDYRQNIKSALNILLKTDLQIVDETGQTYNPDAFHID